MHDAAEAGRLGAVRTLLDAEPGLLNRQDQFGSTPLHRAVLGRSQRVVAFLLDRGADLHARTGAGRAAYVSYPPQYSEPIDLAIWGGQRYVKRPAWHRAVRMVRWCVTRPFRTFQQRAGTWPRPCDPGMTRRLIARGATYDITITAALGDLAHVTTLLDQDPSLIQSARPNLRRPLTAAVEYAHDDIARLLLARGADPTWPDADDSPRGGALHHAARRGHRDLVELLLQHGADPNAHVDSAGSAMFVAKTPEIRALLKAHGGTLDPYDLVWLGQDDEAFAEIAAHPESAYAGCGGVYPAVVTRSRRNLLRRLLDAGVKVPPKPSGCHTYMLEQPDMLKQLLERGGLDPDYTDENGATFLHHLCWRDPRGWTMNHRTEVAAILLDAGAALSPVDKRGFTPLAWAAHNNLPDMVEFFRARGAQ